MLKIISILPIAKQQKLRAYLHQNRCHLQADSSSYGVGRQRYWLEHEPILGSGGRQYHPAFHQARFWYFCQTLYQRASRIGLADTPGIHPGIKPDLGLVAYGKVGIRTHRDDPYAACPAVTINLSTTLTQWGYTSIYRGYEKRNPKRTAEKIHYLPPGAVVMFNSQNPHRVINPDAERWSINLWRIATPCRPYFERYLAQNSPATNNAVSFFPQVGEKYYGQERAKGHPGWQSAMGLP